MWKLAERLGLDWFPIMLGIVNFDNVSTLYPKTLPEVRAKFDNINDEKKLDDAINFCDGLLKREENRSDKIESKAFTLIGITGIAAGFITGFAALLLDPGKIIVTPVSIIAAILYVLVVISLMVTILLAVRVVIVHDYRFTYPSANDIFKLADANLAYVKRERAASLFYSFAQNVHIVNRKATYLGGAQLWFRNSIMLLLLLSLCLAVYTPVKAITVTAPIFIPTPTLTPTNTAIPSSTPTPAIAPTSIPAVTPSWTPTVTPTVTATHTPAPTPSNTSTTTPLPSSTVPAARTP